MEPKQLGQSHMFIQRTFKNVPKKPTGYGDDFEIAEREEGITLILNLTRAKDIVSFNPV